MELSFFYSVDTWIISVFQFLIMLACIQAGRWAAQKTIKIYAENPGNVAVTTSLYGLLGLILAFTFGMSGDRFTSRRNMIVEEANCIGTAVLRLDLYPDSVQPLFRENFQKYLEARIKYYTTDTAKIKEALSETDAISKKLWAIASRQSVIPSNLAATNQMIPALNEMFDVANTRLWGEYNRTPTSILTMLFFLCFSIAFMNGYTSVGSGKFDWKMAIVFCFLVSVVIFITIDLDKPRRGIITLDANAKAMTDLRKMFE